MNAKQEMWCRIAAVKLYTIDMLLYEQGRKWELVASAVKLHTIDTLLYEQGRKWELVASAEQPDPNGGYRWDPIGICLDGSMILWRRLTASPPPRKLNEDEVIGELQARVAKLADAEDIFEYRLMLKFYFECE